MIDTPGEIEFCGAFSEGVRITDGSIFVIDYLEGTKNEIFQSRLKLILNERVKFILFINKMDKLFFSSFNNLKLNENENLGEEIYQKLDKEIVNVNFISSQLGFFF